MLCLVILRMSRKILFLQAPKFIECECVVLELSIFPENNESKQARGMVSL